MHVNLDLPKEEDAWHAASMLFREDRLAIIWAFLRCYILPTHNGGNLNALCTV